MNSGEERRDGSSSKDTEQSGVLFLQFHLLYLVVLLSGPPQDIQSFLHLRDHRAAAANHLSSEHVCLQ